MVVQLGLRLELAAALNGTLEHLLGHVVQTSVKRVPKRDDLRGLLLSGHLLQQAFCY